MTYIKLTKRGKAFVSWFGLITMPLRYILGRDKYNYILDWYAKYFIR